MWQVAFYTHLLFITNIFFIILQLVQVPMSTSRQACTDTAEAPIDAPSSIPVSGLRFGKSLPFSAFIFYFLFQFAIHQLTPAQETILQFLHHLLPIISSSYSSSTSGYIRRKVKSNLDYFLPFHQHAPSLANAQREIYADVD